MTNQYDIISEADESTVVSAYKPKDKPSTCYQSEADLEQALIRQLEAQGYEYLPIHTEADLIANLRRQIEQLNRFCFTDAEWQTFFAEHIANPNLGIAGKTQMIQNDYIRPIRLKDGTTKNIYLLDKQTLSHLVSQ